MPEKFPHLQGETPFPNVENVAPYEQYKNVFDYTRWKPNSKITLLNVPWDDPTVLGGNVVKFDSDVERDAWFDAQQGSTITNPTEFRIQLGAEIRLPVPFDVAQLYNYVMVDFGIATSAEEMLPYETTNGIRRYFYFLKDTSYSAASVTACKLELDVWTTYINHMDIKQMMLTRGHAPMKKTNVDLFLKDPLSHSSWLLYPEPTAIDGSYKVSSTVDDVFNETVYAVIIATGDLRSEWGSESAGTWTTPTDQYYLSGVPSSFAYAVETDKLTSFLLWLDTERPQFMQTVKAVCFVGKDLISLTTTFTIGGIIVSMVSPRMNVDVSSLELTPEMFGYPEQYAWIPKLYTSPFAMVRLATSTGESFDLAIENMGAAINVNIAMSLIDPEMIIDAHVNGYGNEASDVKRLSFSTITTRTRSYGGQWSDIAWKWSIPCYSIMQSSRKHNEYADFYGRVQATNDYENAYQIANLNAETAKLNSDDSANTAASNAKASAETTLTNATNSYNIAYQNSENAANTAYTNAKNSADTSKSNADVSADVLTSNTVLTVANNTALKDKAKEVATSGVELSNNKLQADTNSDIALSAAGLLSELQNATIAATNNDAKAKASVATAGINSVQSLLDAQVGTALFGSVQSAINTTTDWTCTNNSLIVSMWSSTYMFTHSELEAKKKTTSAKGTNTATLMLQNGQLDFNNNQNNSLLTSVTSANAKLAKDNASRTQSAALTNAQNTKNLALTNAGNDKNLAETNAQNTRNRSVANAEATQSTALTINERNYVLATGNATRNRTNAQESIANGIEQASMAAPFEFGRDVESASGVVAPMFVSWQIMRQSDDAISTIGDAMLRYGYSCARNWNFDGFHIMSKFTYWEANDVWVTSEEGVIDSARTTLKTMLYNGITVWNDPQDIKETTIYDNK